MPFSSLVTSLRVDLTELRRGLQQAEAELRRFHQAAQQAGTVRIVGPAGMAGRPTTIAGARTPGARGGESVEHAAQRFLMEAYRDAGRRVMEDARDRSRRQRELDREEERIRRQVLREQSRLAIQQGFATPLGAAGRRVEEQRLQGRFAEDARRARIARGMQRAEERQAAQITRELGLPSRAQEVASERQRRAEQRREFVRQSQDARRDLQLQDREERERRLYAATRRTENRRVFTQEARDFRRDLQFQDRETRQQRRREETIAAENARFFGLPSRAQEARGMRGLPQPRQIGEINRQIGQGLTAAFDRATRAANALGLITNVSLLGGLAGLVAEGFRLNSALERVNLTMAATLATTNEVVDAQGHLVEGPTRANFLLQGTAGLFEQIRKEAAKTILEQQELIETVAENLSLAQQAGFKLKTLSPKETQPIVTAISQIAQLAKAVGLPGGQRQLSQEVRALFLGERLQGATVARLLGFQSAAEIKRLQARPGKEGGTEFVDELTKRFERAKPILDAFAESATGIFTTLISQVRLFLQVATEAAFKEIVGTARGLRDFLSDERVRASAQDIGRSFGQIAREAISLGRSLAPLLQLLRFMVDNAATILAVTASFRLVRGVQAVTAGLGGGAAAAGGVGVAGGVAGGAAGGLLGRLAVARGAAGGIAGAARFGTAGRLAALALGLGATPAAAITGTALTGLGIGTGINFLTQGLPQQIGMRQGAQATPEFTERGQRLADVRAARLRTREQRLRVEREAREFERRGGAARFRQPELTFFERLATGLPSPGEFFGRQPIAERFRRLRVPELTERVGRPEDLRRRSEELGRIGTQQRRTAQQLALQEQARIEREQQLKAKLALAEVNRDREAALKVQAKLDQGRIITEFSDEKARAVRLVALNRQLARDLRELREDEALQNREILAQGLNDEVEIARIRAQRAENEVRRRIRDEKELAKVLPGIQLAAQREILQAQIARQGRRVEGRVRLAGAEGRTIDVIRDEGRQQLLEAARLRADLQINDEEFNRFHTAIIRDTARKEIAERRRIRDEAIDLAMQVTDIARRSSELQRDYSEQLIEFQERVFDRERALNRARIQGIQELTRAQQQARETREDLGATQAGQALRRRAFDFLTTGSEATRFLGVPTVEEAVRRQIEEQLRRQGVGRGERGAITGQRTQEFLRGLLDTLLGGGGVEGTVEQLQGLGIQPTRGIRAQLAGFATQAGTLAEQQRVRQFSREDLRAREQVIEADQAVAQAQEQRQDTERQNRRALRDEARDRRRIDDDFLQAQANLVIEFGRTQVAIQLFAEEAKRAGVALNEGITRVLSQFLGARVPAPEAGVATEARRQIERARTPRPTGAPITNQRSEGTIIINIPIGQLGADTKQVIETLGEKLTRDARRTPVS